MVLVQFRVTVNDVERFKAAYEKWQPTMKEEGCHSARLYQSESDPNEVTTMEEWDSHDAMHASSEKHGDAFQDDAGTQGLDWETRIWHQLV